MIDRLEPLVVRIMQPLDGFAFVFVSINVLIGNIFLGDWLGSNTFVFAGCCVFFIAYAGCAAIDWRFKHRHPKECAGLETGFTSTPPSNLPLKFVGRAALCFAIYGWGMLLGIRYPKMHPVGGEMPEQWMYVLVIALGSGFLLVGIAGLADPRICFAVDRLARKLPLPVWARMVGWGLLLTGSIAGGYLAYLVTTIVA